MRLMTGSPSSLQFSYKRLQRIPCCIKHFTIISRQGLPLREENYIETGPRPAELLAYGSHTPLGGIAPNRISVLLPCYKSNTALMTVLTRSNNQGDCRLIQTFARRENGGNLGARLYSAVHDATIYALRRLRPLARRADKTARPPRVDIRARNP